MENTVSMAESDEIFRKAELLPGKEIGLLITRLFTVLLVCPGSYVRVDNGNILLGDGCGYESTIKISEENEW